VSNRLVTRSIPLGAVLCLLVIGHPLASQDADILGEWDVSVSTPQGQDTSAPMVLKKEGGKIVGTYSSPQGDQPVEADVKNNTVTIWFSVRTQSGPMSITMNGTAEGGAMKGTLDVEGRGQGRWFAKRPAAATATQDTDTRLDVTGTWNFQVESGAGTTTPTMTFKQDGGKLSGHYSGQLGEAPLAGTVKGSAIEFAIDITLEGNTIHIVYAGTVEKDSIKGTAKFGDLGEGTFTAKRKS
jgi:hypothetical protein